MLNATIVKRRERAIVRKIRIWFNFTTQIVTLDHSEGVIPTSQDVRAWIRWVVDSTGSTKTEELKTVL